MSDFQVHYRIEKQRTNTYLGAVFSAAAGFLLIVVAGGVFGHRGLEMFDAVNMGIFGLLSLLMLLSRGAASDKRFESAFKLALTDVVIGIVALFINVIFTLTATKDWIVASPVTGIYAVVCLVHTIFAACFANLVK